jgi:hypothetical protein
MTEQAHDPYRLQRLLDRRGFLSLSSLTAGAFVGLSPIAAAANGKPHRPKRGVSVRNADDTPRYHSPYQLDSSSVLSEDHFLVQTEKVDKDKDTVVAYSRPDGQVEAVRLHNGVISQVFRDPSAPGGWDSREIAVGAADMVAGVAVDKGGTSALHVFYLTVGNKLKHLRLQLPGRDGLSSGTFDADPNTLDWSSVAPGKLQISIDIAQHLLVFCVSPKAFSDGYNRIAFYWTGGGFLGVELDPQAGILSGLSVSGLASGSDCGAAVTYRQVPTGFGPSLLVYTPTYIGGDNPLSVSVSHYSLPETVGGNTNLSGSVTPLSTQPGDLGGPLVKSIDYVSSPSGQYLPTAVVRDYNEKLYTLTYNITFRLWRLLPLVTPTLGKNEKLRWAPSNISLTTGDVTKTTNLMNLFVVSGDTLSVIRQVDQGDVTANALQPVFNPPVPLQGGVAAVVPQTRPSRGDELIVVGADGNLQVVTKTGDGGWSSTEIQLPASEAAEVATYRVQLSLTDDWSFPVADQKLQITTSEPAMALVDGRGVTLADTPVTVTTDANGQVTIPIVADGLFAPRLSIAGDGLPGPATVSPSRPLNDYMAGTATLNLLPPMKADTLATAKTAGGQPVWPAAYSNPDIADQAAKVLAGVAAAANNPTISTLSVPDWTHVTTGGHARQHKPAHRHGVALGSRPRTVGDGTVTVEGVTFSFADLAHDAVYAIKTGAAKVKQVAVTWDDKLKRWVTTVVADFAAWAQQSLKVVINGLEDAADVFHGVMNRLGAVLDDVIDWLKTHVLGLLRDTITVAAKYESWMLQTADELHDLIGRAKGSADGWFESQRVLIHQQLDDVKAAVGARSIESLGAAAQPSDTVMVEGVSTDAPTSDANGQYLHEKISQQVVTAVSTPSLSSDLQQLLKDVEDKLSSEGQDFLKAGRDFIEVIDTLVKNPKDFGTVGVGKLIDVLGDLLDAALVLGDLLVDVILDLLELTIDLFRSIVMTRLDDLPLVTPLLKAAGMDRPLTIGGLVCLLFEFPMVMGYKIANDAAAVPFADVSVSSQSTAGESPTSLFGVAAGAAMITWAGLNGGGLVWRWDTGKATPAWLQWVDIAAPLIITALSVPSVQSGEPFKSPFKTATPGQILSLIGWAFGAVPGLLNAVRYVVVKRLPAGAPDQAKTAVNDPFQILITIVGALGLATAATGAALSAQDLAKTPLPTVTAVLSRMRPTLSFGLHSAVVNATEQVSLPVVGVVGGLCLATAGGIKLRTA